MRRGPRYYGEVAILWCGAALLLGVLVAVIVLVPKANRLLVKSNASIDTVNRPCSKDGKNCGTLASLNSAATSLQGVATSAQGAVTQVGQVAKAAQGTITSMGNDVHAESAALIETTQASKTAITGAANQMTQDLATLNTVLAKAQPIEDSANSEILALHATTLSLNEQLNSQLLHNMLKSMAGIADNMNGTTSDIRIWTHRELYPPKCKGRVCVARRIWGAIKVGSTVAPGAYWATKFVQAASGN